jgi:DNA-binding transcriptional ArsR family regulator
MLSETFAALADPTRRAIVDRLARGPRRVTEIAEPFDMSLNAISKHIKVLERAGIVKRERDGRDHHLTLQAGRLREVARYAAKFERFWNERIDRLAAFIEEEEKKK